MFSSIRSFVAIVNIKKPLFYGVFENWRRGRDLAYTPDSLAFFYPLP